ncbi:MAG: hypothetical protein Q7U64_14670 [Desulfocapsaceae bacterium]|nr:hypothetical protein [Desulfocapsaceae bacterium]
MKRWISGRAVALSVCMGLLSCGPVLADEVTDSITQGLDQYKKGSYAEAMTSLNFAAQKIGQIKADGLKVLIPKPLAGWTADEVVSEAAGTAMFGGGLSAEGRYHKGDKGDITVKIVTDSPLLQSMMMLISNPMFATSSGGKLEKIKNQTAIVKYEAQGKRGDINVVVAGKVLVTVEGNEVTQDELMAYAKAVDYEKIAAMP